MGLKRFLTTLAMGAGAMYLLDPERGEQRRSEFRERWTQLGSEAEKLWRDGVSDLQQRAQDVRNRAQSVAEDGVQQATGAARQAAGSLQQAASQGMNATVSGGGPLSAAMEGGRMQGQMAPGPRLLAVAGGSLLTLYGRTQRGLKGGALTALGMNFVTQGLVNKSLPQVVKRTQDGALEVQKTLLIDAPLDEVYRFWRSYDNFPRFMSHIQEVREMGGGRSHWVAKGPAGVPVEWDARITAEEPDRLLAWQSEPESTVYNRGQVKFMGLGKRTQINVQMSYSPPGGAVGHAVAEMFGADPKTAMDQDLDKLKALLEQGSTQVEGKRVTRSELSGGQGDRAGASAGGVSPVERKPDKSETAGNSKPGM